MQITDLYEISSLGVESSKGLNLKIHFISLSNFPIYRNYTFRHYMTVLLLFVENLKIVP